MTGLGQERSVGAEKGKTTLEKSIQQLKSSHESQNRGKDPKTFYFHDVFNF